MKRCYIGYDPRDDAAYKVLVQSILDHTSEEIEIIPIKEWELRAKGIYWRSYSVDRNGQMWDDRDGKPFSTQFSFSRFAVPLLEGHGDDWVLFMDADMMVRADITEVWDYIKPDLGLLCVQHDHLPKEDKKMDGVIQTKYRRKNWSSLMLMKPSMCVGVTPYALNNQPGSYLHQLGWIGDGLIGEIPKEWNFLAGYDDPSECSPKNVHFTLGTPDMQGINAVKTPYDTEWWGTHCRVC